MIDALLDRFRRSAHPGPFGYPWVYHHPGAGVHGKHVVIGCLIHGNEHGTLPAACEFAEQLARGDINPGGPVTLFLGNVAAARADQRFLEEDFNRVFTFDRPAHSLERRLAESVRPILDAADVFLDFHQTQTPTQRPFWTFPWSPELGDWAHVLAAAPVALTRPAGQSFSQGTCCLDEYVRHRGRVGITVELGYRGPDPTQAANALAVMRRLVNAVDALEAGATLQDLAAKSEQVTFYATSHIVPALTSHHKLRPCIENWTYVEENELLSPPDVPEVRAPSSGYILFPKYPKPTDPPPPELFRLARKVEDLAELDG